MLVAFFFSCCCNPLQRMMALYVASHYKNSPNDLQLMADAPAHHLFVLLGMVFPLHWTWFVISHVHLKWTSTHMLFQVPLMSQRIVCLIFYVSFRFLSVSTFLLIFSWVLFFSIFIHFISFFPSFFFAENLFSVILLLSKKLTVPFLLHPMMPRQGMDKAGARHVYGRDMDLTTKRWSISYDTTQYFNNFEVSGHHRLRQKVAHKMHSH